MPKILLSSICRPIGPSVGDAPSVGYELLHGQVTRAQGIFSPRCWIHHFSLEFVAHNLESPAVVLQYPNEKEFIEELKKGYDFVGISFVLSTYHHMQRMSALIRKYAPQAKIILGGYGTVLSDEELQPFGDYFCREEGVAFIRRTLGEPVKPMPYDHPVILNGLRIFSVPVGNNGMIFGGLGCAHGCDFCATSHFFKRQHIRFLPEGDHIFEVIKRYQAVDPKMNFTVLDEDFLLNQKRARRYLELVRQSGEKPPLMFVFGSVKALSQYTVEELLEMGISGVWVGYEGQRSGYAKQQGRSYEELFNEFRQNGIHVLASMIVGFDYQTPEVIREELAGLMKLQPTFGQFLIYGPTPGTPFYKRVMEEKSLLPSLAENLKKFYKACTGFYSMVKHPTMKPETIEDLQKECFDTDFKTLGPSIIRSAEAWMLGYKNLKNHPNPLIQHRVQSFKQDLLNALPIFWTAILFGPSKAARKRSKDLHDEILRTFKVNPVKHAALSVIMIIMAGWTALCLKFKWFQHPKLVREEYRMSGSV